MLCFSTFSFVRNSVMEEESAFPPSFPGVSPVQLMDCLEELLKFTLSSSVEETLEIDIGLSKDYCSGLLKLGLDDIDNSGGIPNYPLYMHLASALNNCITCGSGSRVSNVMTLIQEDESFKQKEKDWNKIILEKGLELVEMLKDVNFELHVQEPFFMQLRVGLKSVEGRCAVGDYNRIGAGALILFNKCLLVEVEDVKRYASFADMLKAESLDKVLPGVKTIEEGVQIYRKFYTEEKESSHGVLAISVSKLASQPYVPLAIIISGLSYDGIGSLLGLMHTTGTVSEALPPPKTALLSSFLKSHKPNVKGSALTDGARALAKHVSRVSDGWWGVFDGNDSNKNRLAWEVINQLITNCCWINIHIVPPNDSVFEIRVAEGYGARWSKDGSKFIGFLEPYMEDGHSKRWKH